MKKITIDYEVQISEDGAYGWEAILTKFGKEDVILDSSHYGSFNTKKSQKEILEQFKNTLGIKRFSKVSKV